MPWWGSFEVKYFFNRNDANMTPFAGMKSSHSVTIALAVVVVVPEVL